VRGLCPTSLLIDDDIPVDCGTGVSNLDSHALRRLRHVFLIHAHFDQLAALPLLIDSMFDYFKNRPFIVHCCEETYHTIRRYIFSLDFWSDFLDLPDGAAPAVRYELLLWGESVNNGGPCMESITVNYTALSVAHRIESSRAALAFSGDTTTNDTFRPSTKPAQ
jgi:ribonuclease BN (tRNA processing enzyme)